MDVKPDLAFVISSSSSSSSSSSFFSVFSKSEGGTRLAKECEKEKKTEKKNKKEEDKQGESLYNTDIIKEKKASSSSVGLLNF